MANKKLQKESELKEAVDALKNEMSKNFYLKQEKITLTRVNKLLKAKQEWQAAIQEANRVWTISVSEADKIFEDIIGEIQ